MCMKINILKSKFSNQICLFVLFIAFGLNSYSQSVITDSSSINKARLRAVIISETAIFAGSLTGLYALWYKNYPMNSFHFFNDNGEWNQMDKISHAGASYYIGKVGYEALKWSGVKEKKAIWYGGLYGSAFLLTIEILDGFSDEWGFSYGDLCANTLGSAMFISQQLAWHEQRVVFKFSSHPTDYAQYRPDLFGSNFPQRIMKDYNGWTYWLSGNISSFLPKSSGFPKWLNIAVGLGADGMTGTFDNAKTYKGKPLPDFTRSRQFYLSLDIDLTRIPTKSKTLDKLFDVIGFIKIPFPALEYNTNDGFRGHLLYF